MENSIHSIVKALLTTGKQIYYSFINNEGKQWIMPKRNMVTAMNLYQPSGKKGKLVKALLPYLHSISPVRKKIGITIHYYDLQKEVENLLNQLFNINDIEFSIFCGTPSVHQKITMQISHKENILGYCKFTTVTDVKEIFKHEYSILRTLHQKGLRNIPKILYCGLLKKNIWILVQTTTKTKHSKVIHKVTPQHWDFLSKLQQKTASHIIYENTDFHRTLSFLLSAIETLIISEQKVVKKAIEQVETFYGKQYVDFGFYQGDFTPWNMYQEKNELFVFDWEYSQQTYPPYMDYFHFFTQIHFFEKQFDSKQIYDCYLSSQDQLKNYIEFPDMLYISYLLGFVALYLERDKDNLDANTRKSVTERIQILSMLLNESH